jgi:hypothetical protein
MGSVIRCACAPLEEGTSMVKGRCAECQIFVVHEEIDRLILSGWMPLEDAEPADRGIVPMLCPDCRRKGKRKTTR